MIENHYNIDVINKFNFYNYKNKNTLKLLEFLSPKN